MNLYRDFGLPKHLEIKMYRDIPVACIDTIVSDAENLFERYSIGDRYSYLKDNYITLQILYRYKEVANQVLLDDFKNIDIFKIFNKIENEIDDMHKIILDIYMSNTEFEIG